jgi:hypothetical protein
MNLSWCAKSINASEAPDRFAAIDQVDCLGRIHELDVKRKAQPSGRKLGFRLAKGPPTKEANACEYNGDA